MVTPYYPPHVGGIEYHVKNISKNLIKRGHKISILTSYPKKLLHDDLYSDADVFRIKMIYPFGRIYPSLNSEGFSANIRTAIKQIVTEKKIDIIHAHGHHFYLTLRAIELGRELRIPSILTLHGLYALNPNDRIAQVEEEIFNRTIFRRELTKATAIIGLTPTIVNYARKYYPTTQKYFTIPNGVNSNIFNENKKNRLKYRQKLNISKEKIVILYVGRFESIKGVLELAEAAKLFVQKNNDALFLFVGGGTLTMQLAKALKPIKGNSTIIDWISSEQIHELYIASDIFVLPSKSEALPLTILEAMAAQLYIVATQVGGIPEVLKKYNHKTLLDSISPEEISLTLLNVFKQNDFPLANNCKTSFIDYMQPYDWEKITHQVEEAYSYARMFS